MSKSVRRARFVLLLAFLVPVSLLVTEGFGQSWRAAGDPELPRACVDTT